MSSGRSIESDPIESMNGRVYDPTLGRFLSADPNVQAAGNSQSYNRYSYVLNNPLRYTDPSGYFWKGLKKFVKKYWKPIVAIGLAIVTGGAAAAAIGGFWGAVAGGAVGGFVSGGIMTGTLRGALTGAAVGAISGGITYGIGHGGAAGSFMDSARKFAGGFGRHLMHGVAQGGMSHAQGGSFRSGFWGGSMGSGVQVNQNASLTAKAVVGGTASRLGGGKFANGAMSGAFVQMFNHGMNKVRMTEVTHPRTGEKLLVPTAVAADVYNSLQSGESYGDYMTTTVGEVASPFSFVSLVTGVGALLTRSAYFGWASLTSSLGVVAVQPTPENIQGLVIGVASAGAVRPGYGNMTADAVDSYSLLNQAGSMAK